MSAAPSPPLSIPRQLGWTPLPWRHPFPRKLRSGPTAHISVLPRPLLRSLRGAGLGPAIQPARPPSRWPTGWTPPTPAPGPPANSEAVPARLAPASWGLPPLASTVPHARSLSPHLTGNESARLVAVGVFRHKGTTRVVRPSGTDALAAGATKNSSILDTPSTLCASTCVVLPSPRPASFAVPGCPRPRPSPVAA